jgi:hypothetical protein
MPAKKGVAEETKLEWGKIIIPALVGLVGVIITTVCGFFSTVVIAMLPNMPFINHAATATPLVLVVASATPLPQPTATRDLPKITFKALDYNVLKNTEMSIYGKRGGNEYVGISPDQCWNLYVPNSKDPNPVERIDAVPLNYTFVVLSSKSVVISDITVHLDKYTPPPDPKTLSEVMYVYGRGGGGEVPLFVLENADIGADFKRASLSVDKSYRIEGTDALSFTTTLYFTEPGEYQVHFELEIDDYSGKTFAYSSQPLAFSWLYLEYGDTIKVKDGGTGGNLTVSPCGN